MNHSASALKSITLVTRHSPTTIIKVIGIGDCGKQAIEQLNRQNISGIEGCIFDPNELTTSISYGRENNTNLALKLLAHDADLLIIAASSTDPIATQLAHITEKWGISIISVLEHPNNDVHHPFALQTHSYISAPTGEFLSVLIQTASSLAMAINVPGLINLDFADLQTLLAINGRVKVSTASAAGKSRALHACAQLVDDTLSKAQAVLIHVKSSSDLKLSELDEIMSNVASSTPDALLMIASTFDESMTSRLSITLIATGLPRANM